MWSLCKAGRHVIPGEPIDVGQPRVSRQNRRCRVTAVVDGRGIWFESADLPLIGSTEAFGAALLVPALHAGRPLRLTGPACGTWTQNLARLTDALHQLWYPQTPRPLVVPRAIPTDGPGDHGCGSSATVLCFSGGVDAFHSLLAGGLPIDILAMVTGYDVAHRDRRRAAAVRMLLREVAAETGHASVLVTTNLRRHPLLKATPWLRAFAGPLAAIGHLLGPTAGRILLSSDGLGFEHPEVGSRPSTDPLHGSARLRVDHVAHAVTRNEKIRRLAAEPLVQRHLRVCWQNVGSRLNCGRCEKCIRTMLALDACGMLGRYPGFDRGRNLVAAIDGLATVDGVVEPFYRELLDQGLSTASSAAVRRLLERSTAGAGAGGSARRPHAAAASRSLRHRRPRPVTRHALLSPAAFSHVCRPLVGHRVGYIRPVGNVGDQLIEMAMIQLFAEYGIHWRLVSPDAAGAADGLDLLVFGGGGNMGERYAGNHALRSQTLSIGLPVVILPQSFTSREDRPYATVFVRERASLALRPDGILAPDLALALATTEPRRPDRDLGVYLRRDQERGGRKPLLTRDPVRLHHDPFRYLALAARYRRIVTDRLHFAVAGLHAGREVTLVANDYHKNRSMHETWLSELGCRFATTPAEALAAAGRRPRWRWPALTGAGISAGSRRRAA